MRSYGECLEVLKKCIATLQDLGVAHSIDPKNEAVIRAYNKLVVSLNSGCDDLEKIMDEIGSGKVV